MSNLVLQNKISKRIFLIRGHRVMLDSDLALLYGVEVKYLTRQVRRNATRFPIDFMFILTKEEFLRRQFGTSKKGGRRYLPYVFTEQGVAMLSSVLNGGRAIQVNAAIMRAFVKLREILFNHKELADKLEELERKVEKHDGEIKAIFSVIHQLMSAPEKSKRKIGFRLQ